MSTNVTRTSLQENFTATAHINHARTHAISLTLLEASGYAPAVLGVTTSPEGIDVTIDLGTDKLREALRGANAFAAWCLQASSVRGLPATSLATTRA